MSTTSEIPPSSRPSTTDPPSNPISLFDVHLKYLTDSYLNFFLERQVHSYLLVQPCSESDTTFVRQEESRGNLVRRCLM